MPAVLQTASHIGEDSECMDDHCGTAQRLSGPKLGGSSMDAQKDRKQEYKAQVRPDYKMILRRHGVKNDTDTVLCAR